MDHMHTFWPHKDMEGLPWWWIGSMMGATSETIRTWNTIHTIHSPIHSDRVDMKWWLWWPDDIRGPCGSKASWNLSQVRKNPETLRKLVPTWDRSRTRCVTGDYATACSIAADVALYIIKLWLVKFMNNRPWKLIKQASVPATVLKGEG